jgi:hypothetical protein
MSTHATIALSSLLLLATVWAPWQPEGRWSFTASADSEQMDHRGSGRVSSSTPSQYLALS